jgi:hypothetical protein
MESQQQTSTSGWRRRFVKATTVVKRNNSDFALWKASKPGEPSWPSPWLPELGIYIEDHPYLPDLVQPLDKSLAALLEDRKAATSAKNAETQARRNAEENQEEAIDGNCETEPFQHVQKRRVFRVG